MVGQATALQNAKATADNANDRITLLVGQLAAATSRITAIESQLGPLLSASPTTITLLASLVQASHLANDNSTTDTWDSDGRNLWNLLKAAMVSSNLMA
jgi:hypothetical protein